MNTFLVQTNENNYSTSISVSVQNRLQMINKCPLSRFSPTTTAAIVVTSWGIWLFQASHYFQKISGYINPCEEETTHYLTEREREMFLLLILLISPAFGRPSSSQLGVEVVNQLEIFTSFNNETGKIFLNSSVIENVVRMLLEAERNILEMNAELKTLEIQEIQIEENYFLAFNKAKSYLRETRQGLRKLADRTVKDVRDLKILLGGLDNTNDPIFLKIFINRMKDLMIETLESLKEAKEKYNSAVETFDNLNSSIKAQNLQLQYLTELQEAENQKQRNETEAFKASFQCKVLPWLTIGVNAAFFDICALFVNLQTTVEIEFIKLKRISDRMFDSGNNFDQAIKAAIGILTEEIELISIWKKSAKVVNKNIDEYPAEYLRQYKSVRNIFISGLDDLKNAADEFLKQPKDIFELN